MVKVMSERKKCRRDGCENDKTPGSGVLYCAEHRREAITSDYSARHKQVRAVQGRAAEQDCVRCSERGIKKNAREWATIHGTGGSDPLADYIPLCVPCHAVYDDKPAKMSAARRGVKRGPVESLRKPWSAERRQAYENNNTWKKCEPGCTCGRHSAEVREKSRQRLLGKEPANKGVTGGTKKKCEPGCTCGKHDRSSLEAMQRTRRERGVNLIQGPDGKFMSRAVYEAEVGQPCQI
jgi:hypothetical protein